MIIESVCVNE